MSLEAMPLDERRKFVRQMEEYGDVLSLVALIQLVEGELSSW